MQVLRQNPDLSAFFCVNDQMALGVAEAIWSMSLRRRIIVVGVDLIDEAESAILADEIDASVAFSVSNVSRVLLDAAIKRIKGQSIPDCFSVASYLVDRQMLTQ